MFKRELPPLRINSQYLHSVLDPVLLSTTADKTIEKVRELRKRKRFDTIAYCGMSGAAMSFILSRELNIPLVCVRKENDGSHFWEDQRCNSVRVDLEGNLGVQKYLIVDDFISSGSTIERICQSIKKHNSKAKCAGAVMYSHSFKDYKYSSMNIKIDVYSIGKYV